MTRTKTRTRKGKRPTRRQRGSGFDIQKLLTKTGIEFHWPGYQYMGPGTKLAKRLKRGDPGINRLDKIAKQHDIDYSHAKNLRDKWQADTKMIKAIDKLPGNKTLTEKIVKRIMQTKKKFKIVNNILGSVLPDCNVRAIKNFDIKSIKIFKIVRCL